jgi:HEAT repeats
MTMATKPAQRGPITVLLMILGILCFSAFLTYFMHKNSTTDSRQLESHDPAAVIEALTAMKERHDPTGVAKATTLLNNANPEIANNAALYLGAMGKSVSIPYLITALKTPDDEIRNEISLDLSQMTGEFLGDNYDAWQTWWQTKNGATTQANR